VSDTTGPWHESPSLSEPQEGAGPAFELKFVLEEGRAAAIEDFIRGRLPLDPHGDPALGGAYRTTTLYLDTPRLDVYHRADGFKRRKYRLRRYGTAARIFLERKTKSNDRVRKQRTDVPPDELPLLANPLSVITWPGHWFHQLLITRGLRPTCLIGYERTAYAAATAEGPLRLTVDRRLRGAPASAWDVPPLDGGLTFLAGQAILEFKFRTALPTLFKELIQEFRLSPGATSKYRQCMQSWGAADGRREVADA
jgi:hypothetical protein